MRRPQNVITIALLLGIALLGTSCVYIRLLHLKRQIAQFQEHFEAQTANGLVLRFLDPVLLEDDMRTIGLPPSRIEGDAENPVWTYFFKKLYRKNANEDGAYDIILTASFDDRRLAQVAIDEAYFRHLPKSFLVELFQSAGRAQVDVLKRRVVARPSELATPTAQAPVFSDIDLDAVIQTLGQPYSRTEKEGEITCRYRYRLLSPPENDDSTATSGPRYTVTFVFNAQDHTLDAIHGILPSAGKITFQ